MRPVQEDSPKSPFEPRGGVSIWNNNETITTEINRRTHIGRREAGRRAPGRMYSRQQWPQASEDVHPEHAAALDRKGVV